MTDTDDTKYLAKDMDFDVQFLFFVLCSASPRIHHGSSKAMQLECEAGTKEKAKCEATKDKAGEVRSPNQQTPQKMMPSNSKMRCISTR